MITARLSTFGVRTGPPRLLGTAAAAALSTDLNLTYLSDSRGCICASSLLWMLDACALNPEEFATCTQHVTVRGRWQRHGQMAVPRTVTCCVHVAKFLSPRRVCTFSVHAAVVRAGQCL